MTDAIEAGARAIREHLENDRLFSAGVLSKVCIEAAIASGALVPASAVAEMRERCAQAGWKAAYDSGQIRRHTDTPDEVANAIRQLDITPGGDYVVGWRPMDSAPKDGTDILVFIEKSGEQIVCFWDGDGWRFATFQTSHLVCQPTFWRSLPAVPDDSIKRSTGIPVDRAASRTGGEK